MRTLIHELGKNVKDGIFYIYADYVPRPGIQWTKPHRPGTYPDIMAWIFREYGLKAWAPEIAQVKRLHGVPARPRPEGLEPVEVTPEKEAAILAALRHFGIV